ncbi:hypothetical protein [Marinobacterium sediminicola]|uniref:hypothetical protein n=1 Tax=Marinobacterium sediminicola TaxID=518898 RepID=UPI001EF0A364|nr:hypothetical protein [Marinobacterium sediminicola]ULG67915.1 hypothetical protein LN244_09305 [Marinobacterium sediminicola]
MLRRQQVLLHLLGGMLIFTQLIQTPLQAISEAVHLFDIACAPQLAINGSNKKLRMKIKLTRHIHIVRTTAQGRNQLFCGTFANKSQQWLWTYSLSQPIHQQTAANGGQVEDYQGCIEMLELLINFISIRTHDQTKLLMIALLA